MANFNRYRMSCNLQGGKGLLFIIAGLIPTSQNGIMTSHNYASNVNCKIQIGCRTVAAPRANADDQTPKGMSHFSSFVRRQKKMKKSVKDAMKWMKTPQKWAASH